MIDFRYHLVSIVSIFLALAVGIVLGAGPLKEDLGNTLTSEVVKLRQDRTALKAQLDQTSQDADARDEFTQATTPSLLRDRLKGRVVSVVVLPGADNGVVKEISATLTAAGATIGSTVTVQDAWADPAKLTFRSTLGEQLAPGLALPTSGGGSVVDSVLAKGVLSQNGATNPGAATALEGLRTGELITVAPDQITPASSAVVVSGPVTSGDAEERKARAATLANLAGTLDLNGAGAVLVSSGTRAESTPFVSVAATVRADTGLSRTLTTVDNGEIPMGRASTVLGLLEQYAGRVGQYGFEADARAPFPPLPPQ